jgi:hypothetical protein
MARTTEAPTHAGIRRRTAWLAATVLAITAAVVGVSPPTPAEAGPIYVPRCNFLCLTRTGYTLTAYADLDVGPTPYYISIFNYTTGERLTMCVTGNTCSTTNVSGSQGSGTGGTYFWVAFIGGFPTQMPPQPVYVMSNIVDHNYNP